MTRSQKRLGTWALVSKAPNSHWEVVRVSDLQREGILLVEDGNHGEYRPRRGEFCQEGTAFIRAADMADGQIRFDQASKINEQARQRIRKGIGAPGDVLLSHKGTVGKVALVPDDAPAFVCSPQTTFWRTLAPDQLDRRYLYALLRSDWFHAQLGTRSGETDMAPYVSLTSQRGLLVVMPPIESQLEIANVIGALDDRIELNRQMNRTLEEIAQTLFRAWFVNFEGESDLVESELGPIPRGWDVASLPTVIEVNPRYKLRKKQVVPYVEMKNLPVNSARVDDWRPRAFMSGSRFRNGDTLLARITPCLENGKTAFVDFLEDDAIGWGSTEFLVLRSKPPLPPEYTYFLARTSAFRDLAIAQMTGSSGRQRVRAQALDHYQIAVPPAELAQRFGNVARLVLQRMKTNDEQSRTLAELRDTLLPKLISGEIRVPEAEDLAREAV